MPATLIPQVTMPRIVSPVRSARPLRTDHYCITVSQYHRMISDGYFADDDRVELLEGQLVNKMSKKPPHSTACTALITLFTRFVPDDWLVRMQEPITLDTSEPEPDLALVRGTLPDFKENHPTPIQSGLIVEVADTSLARDEGVKQIMYARNQISTYWIVNLVDQRVQVYREPTAATESPKYSIRKDYYPGSVITVEIDGVSVGSIRVEDILN